MNLEVITLILSISGFVMFIIMFVVVIRIWNFHQEILRSGGYPTIIYSRAKNEVHDILAGIPIFNPNRVGELINILSQDPDDSEAVNLIQRLNDRKE